MDIIALLSQAKAKGASDLHLVVSSPPMLRINGILLPIDGMEPLTPEDTIQALEQLTLPEQVATFKQNLELDFSYSLHDIGRVRCNAAQERKTVSMVIRLLPAIIPTIEDLGLPEALKRLTEYPQGLVLITGPANSGKTTTLAALIDMIKSLMSGDNTDGVEDLLQGIASKHEEHLYLLQCTLLKP